MCCVVKFASRCFPPFTRIPVESSNQIELCNVAGGNDTSWNQTDVLDLRELIYRVQLLINGSPFSTRFSIFFYRNYLEVNVR